MYEIPYYGFLLSDIFWSSNETVSHVKSMTDITSCDKNVKIYLMVSPKCDVKLSVAFLFSSVYIESSSNNDLSDFFDDQWVKDLVHVSETKSL